MAADLYTLSDLSQIARGRLMEIHNWQQTTILVALYWNKLQDSAILRRRQLPRLQNSFYFLNKSLTDQKVSWHHLGLSWTQYWVSSEFYGRIEVHCYKGKGFLDFMTIKEN